MKPIDNLIPPILLWQSNRMRVEVGATPCINPEASNKDVREPFSLSSLSSRAALFQNRKFQQRLFWRRYGIRVVRVWFSTSHDSRPSYYTQIVR